jgi:tyrosyl-tRNA synthetase
MPVRTFPPVDEQLRLLERGAVDLVDVEQLRGKLERSRETGVPLTVKAGFDASTPDLHLGHSVLLRKMKHFQDLGHRVVFLIGTFTAMIGDPSGKKATRPQLTAEEVEANSRTYQEQVFHLLDRETTVIDYNGKWLSALGSEGIIRLAGRYTLARMMEREDFRERFANNQPISLHELLYPLVQGYDSVVLEADVELGGHDQIFNLLVGRTLMKDAGLEPQVVLTVPLLIGVDGTDKMSKSLGNAIALEDPPAEMFGRTMSIPDALMWDWLLLLTDAPEEEIARQRRQVETGELNPMEVKKDLAGRLVTDYHGAAAAEAARAEFETVFSRDGLPDDIPEAGVEAPCRLTRALTATGLAASNREAQRLIEQGAVTVDGERVDDPFAELAARAEAYLVKVGKRRFLRLSVAGSAPGGRATVGT